MFSVLIVMLLIRIFYLQILSSDDLIRCACNQRMTFKNIQKIRGNILDKNGIRFTNRCEKTSIVLKPLILRGEDVEINNIARILNIDYDSLKREIEFKKAPILIDVGNVNKEYFLNMKSKGISLIHYIDRFDEHTLSRHILGYLNKTEHTGVSGLEKAYDKYLDTQSSNMVSAIVDAKSHLVEGIGYKLFLHNPNKLNLKTTLNFHIQKIVESELSSNNINGAVVVIDIKNGDIVAIASSPQFDQNLVQGYLKSSKKELFNRAVASYNVGSIFKIVVAAQMLESKKFNDEPFTCTGSIKILDKTFKCASFKVGGHGYVHLKEAFARSCNPYFIDQGVKLGYKNIIEMAKKLGMGQITGIADQGIEESEGNLEISKGYITDGDVANISIGQGDIMATPVQVANMVATIANGGIKNRVNIVDSIIDDNGVCTKKLKISDDGHRAVSKLSSEILRELMKEVVTNGTGMKIKLQQYGGAAGKTSSAETGQYINGEKIVHAWFAGYFPVDTPKYAISVLVENGKQGGQVAAPIFAQIAEKIMEKGL